MEALLERRRIVRQDITALIGYVEDLLQTTRPAISELTDLANKLTEHHEVLRKINREVECAVDIDNLEVKFEDAFNFDYLVFVAKSKIELQIVETKKARENLIASLKERLRAERRECRDNQTIFSESSKTSYANHTHAAEIDEGRHTVKLDFNDITPIETHHFVYSPEETECEQEEAVLQGTNNRDTDCPGEKVELWPDVLCPPILKLQALEKQHTRKEQRTAKKKCSRTADLKGGSAHNLPQLKKNQPCKLVL